ncbi:MAG TPA: nucleoside deaminase [Gammaproteobacteria bacterium]|jgi:tRNA(adenine34) deaminase|nr:nucleoside deaminase [Gammaproteobacteria bacterium]
MKKEFLMREALVQAKKALKKGEVPIGAVVVLGDEIIGRGYNQPITTKDPTAHAEIIALKEASNRLDNYRLNEAIIYTTLEPCLMCSGALVHARIKKIIFAAQDTKSGVVVNNGGLIQSEFLNHKVSFEGGILEKEASKLLKDFFLEKRS